MSNVDDAGLTERQPPPNASAKPRFTFCSLAAAGFGPHLIPIMPPDAPLHPTSKVDPSQRGKIPGRYHADAAAWTGLPDWTARTFGEVDFAEWDTAWPHPNIGMRTGELLALDIDEDSRDLIVGMLVDLADKVLSRAPMRKRGNSERVLLLYRLHTGDAQPAKMRIAYTLPEDAKPAAVELLGRGQQFVFAGRHPSGADYVWADRGTDAGELADLPEVTPAQWRAFADEAEKLIREIGATIVHVGSAGAADGERKPIGDASLLAPDFTVLAEALCAIPCAELDYQQWIGMLHAVKAACGGDPGFLFDVFIPWSMTHPQASDREWIIEKWDTVHNSTIGAELIFGEARNHGWQGGSADSTFTDSDLPPESVPSPEAVSAAKRNMAPTIRLHAGALDLTAVEAERALVAADDGIYQFGTMLVRPASAEIITAGGDRVQGVRLIQIKPGYLRERLTFAARFVRFDARAKGWVPCNCPPEVAQAILEHGTWTLPVLTGFTSCPVLRPDWTILLKPGYDSATGLLYVPSDGAAAFPAISESPDRAEALAALGELKALIATMDYLGDVDRSVALSAILSVVARRAVPLLPMHAFTATGPGQGKSMHADIVAEIAEGRRAAAIPPGSAANELERQLVSALIKGDAIVSLDNLVEPLGRSAVINACLTQERLDLRVLGKSLNIEVPGNRLLLANGNNLILESDVTRRTILCQLDAKVERPELRAFSHSPIDLIRADRGRYVAAALTMLRAFYVAGRPQQSTPLGGFEPWSRLVRDALIWLGEADPVKSMDTVRSLDPDRAVLGRVILAWVARFGEKPVPAKRLVDAESLDDAVAGKNAELREALEAAVACKGSLTPRAIGDWLRQVRNRIAEGHRIVSSDDSHAKVCLWRAQRV